MSLHKVLSVFDIQVSGNDSWASDRKILRDGRVVFSKAIGARSAWVTLQLMATPSSHEYLRTTVLLAHRGMYTFLLIASLSASLGLFPNLVKMSSKHHISRFFSKATC